MAHPIAFVPRGLVRNGQRGRRRRNWRDLRRQRLPNLPGRPNLDRKRKRLVHGVLRGRDVPQWGNPVRGMPLRLVLGHSRLARVRGLRRGQSRRWYRQRRLRALLGWYGGGVKRGPLRCLRAGPSVDYHRLRRVCRL